MTKKEKEQNEIILCNMIQYLCKRIWNTKYNGVININNRLKTTYAYYQNVNNDNIFGLISMSPIVINTHNNYLITDILLHELTHWYVNYIDKDFDDKAQDFIIELNKVGAKPSHSFDCDNVYNKGFFHKNIQLYVDEMIERGIINATN